jgi:hypothetical protein
VLEAVNKQEQLPAFEQALSLAVFALLKKHESLSTTASPTQSGRSKTSSQAV